MEGIIVTADGRTIDLRPPEIRLIERIEIELRPSTGILELDLRRKFKVSYDLRIPMKAFLLNFGLFYAWSETLQQNEGFATYDVRKKIDELGLRSAEINEFAAYIEQYGYNRSVYALEARGKYDAGFDDYNLNRERLGRHMYEYCGLRCFLLPEEKCISETYGRASRHNHFLCLTK